MLLPSCVRFLHYCCCFWPPERERGGRRQGNWIRDLGGSLTTESEEALFCRRRHDYALLIFPPSPVQITACVDFDDADVVVHDVVIHNPPAAHTPRFLLILLDYFFSCLSARALHRDRIRESEPRSDKWSRGGEGD